MPCVCNDVQHNDNLEYSDGDCSFHQCVPEIRGENVKDKNNSKFNLFKLHLLGIMSIKNTTYFIVVLLNYCLLSINT